MLAGLVVLAFVLRFARWERAAVLFNDGPVFLALAERSAEGAFGVLLQHPFHPLYPLTIPYGQALVAQEVRLVAESRQVAPFNIPVPWITPINTVDGRRLRLRQLHHQHPRPRLRSSASAHVVGWARRRVSDCP